MTDSLKKITSKIFPTHVFLLSHLALVFGILMLVSVNFFSDTTGFFKIHYKDETRLSEFMGDDKNVLIPSSKINFNERILRWFWYTNHDVKKETIIFGSSRARMLNNSFFNWPNPKVFVEVVNGGTLQDFIVFTYLRDKRSGHWPRELVLSIDPHMLSKTNEYADWIEIVYPALYREAVQFYKMNGLPELSKTEFSKFETIQGSKGENAKSVRAFLKFITSTSSFSPNISSFFNSVTTINSSIDDIESTSKQCTEETSKATKFYVFCADGSMPMYIGKETAEEVAEVEKLLLIDPKMPVTESIDPLAINLLEQIVSLYRSNGANVTLLITPPHPGFYEQSERKGDFMGFIKVEKELKKFAKQYNLKLVGSYNNEVIKAKRNCFIDWIHPATCALDFVRSEMKALGVIGQ